MKRAAQIAHSLAADLRPSLRMTSAVRIRRSRSCGRQKCASPPGEPARRTERRFRPCRCVRRRGARARQRRGRGAPAGAGASCAATLRGSARWPRSRPARGARRPGREPSPSSATRAELRSESAALRPAPGAGCRRGATPRSWVDRERRVAERRPRRIRASTIVRTETGPALRSKAPSTMNAASASSLPESSSPSPSGRRCRSAVRPP